MVCGMQHVGLEEDHSTGRSLKKSEKVLSGTKYVQFYRGECRIRFGAPSGQKSGMFQPTSVLASPLADNVKPFVG